MLIDLIKWECRVLLSKNNCFLFLTQSISLFDLYSFPTRSREWLENAEINEMFSPNPPSRRSFHFFFSFTTPAKDDLHFRVRSKNPLRISGNPDLLADRKAERHDKAWTLRARYARERCSSTFTRVSERSRADSLEREDPSLDKAYQIVGHPMISASD